MKPHQTPIGATTARFVAAARIRPLSPEVLDMAKMCLVDWFAVALGAISEPAVEAVRRTAQAMGTRGGALMLLDGATTPAVAALVNGTTAHCLDFDDTHQTGGSHLSAPTWATVLAVAGARGMTEEQALAAFITGYEVGARLAGRDMAPTLHYRGFHPTAIFGRFAAAAACCVLLGLDEQRTAHALALAATQAGGLNASFGTMAKPFHAGKAAMDGILAAELAAEGFEGATDLLDAENGLSRTLIQDGEARIENVEFSEGLALLKNVFKAYACCRASHPHVDAARSLAPQVGGVEVVRVDAQVNPSGAHVAKRLRPNS
jgi:2-methylcitrate dehydratase PrpD